MLPVQLTEMRQKLVALVVAAVVLVIAGLLAPQPARDLLTSMGVYLGLMVALRRSGADKLRPLPLPTWAAVLILVVAAVFICPNLLAGKTLASWDMSMHTWHAHMISERHFPSLRGYVFDLYHGWAEGDDYALFVYLPAVLLHKLTFGLVGLERAVTLEVLFAFIAWPLAMFVFFRREIGAWPALVGALLVLFDPGAWQQTGMVPFLVIGMWTFRLCLALTIFALAAATRFLDDGRARSLLIALVMASIALQSHAGGFAFMGYALMAWMIARPPNLRRSGPLFIGLVGALLTTGWFTLPWFKLRHTFMYMGEAADSPAGLVEKFTSLGLFGRITALETAVFLVGACWLAIRGTFAGRFALACLMMAVIIGSREMALAVFPPSLDELVGSLIFGRFQSYGRGMIVFCGGSVVTALVAWWWTRQVTSPKSLTAGLFGGMLVVGSLTVGIHAGWEKMWRASSLKRVQATPTVESLPQATGMVEAGKWLKEHGPADTLVVVEYDTKPDTTLPHIVGHVQRLTGIPCAADRLGAALAIETYRPGKGDYTADELRAGGVTHWMRQGRGKRPLPSWAHEIGTFAGDVHLFEIERSRPDHRIVAPDGVELVKMDETGIVVRGPSTGFEATVRARYSPRMLATDGRVTLRQTAFMPGSPEIFTTITVPAGVTEATITFGPPPRAELGYACSALGLAIIAACVWRVRRRETALTP